MPWRRLHCLLNRHRADQPTVNWNGKHHVGKCRDCGRLVRRSSRGYWKRVLPSAESLKA